MSVNPNSPTFFSVQSSPTFARVNTTTSQTPGLGSPSIFSADRLFESTSLASPERKLAKSDVIYISKSELEHELRSFVSALVETKAANENEVTQYLGQLKNLIGNLAHENAKLKSPQKSARGAQPSQLGPENEDYLRGEIAKRKNSNEETIKNYSLHIRKLEEQVSSLTEQCQRLMRINHDLNIQMLKMSQIPESSQTAIANQEMSQQKPLNELAKLQQEQIAQFIQNEETLIKDNEQLSSKLQEMKTNLANVEARFKEEKHKRVTFEENQRQSQELSEALKANDDLRSALARFQVVNNKLKEDPEKKEKYLVDLKNEKEALKIQLDKALKHLSIEDGPMSSEERSSDLKFLDTNREELLKHRKTNSVQLGAEKTKKTSYIKFEDQENLTLKEIDLLRKQLADYKSVNAILHKKTEKYLLQIEDLNDALKQANNNLETLQNRYITLEKELANKHKLENIISSHLRIISKLEVKIKTLSEENYLIQKVNEENMITIAELKGQIEGVKTQGNDGDVPFFTPPRSTRRESDSQMTQVDQTGQHTHLYQTALCSPERLLLEKELTKKKVEEKMLSALHEKDMEIRAERIKHKNQIEKYNMNLEVLSKKIQSLVAVNESLGKDLEILKIEFSNYRTLSWSIIQEARTSLDNFGKHDVKIQNSITELQSLAGKEVDKLKKAYEGMRKDILTMNQTIEDRRKYL